MKISDDILRHHLKNVYFLIGTACGGKTTLAKELANKYGFIYFGEHYAEANNEGWREFQRLRKKEDESEDIDWEHYFNREPLVYAESLKESINEYNEFALLEIVKLAQKETVITDLLLPAEIAIKLAPYNRVASLLAMPDLIIQDYFKRESHQPMLDFINTLKDPEKIKDNVAHVLRISNEEVINQTQEIGLFQHLRDNESTIEKTLALIEEHFGLI